MSDLKTVFDAIKAKASKYNALDNYYNGDQPTTYLTQRLREIFRGVDVIFTENWCAVVIDSAAERINLTGFEAATEAVKATLQMSWDFNQLANEAGDIHTDALVLGESFAIVWPGQDSKRAEVYYNDARMVHVVYAADSPRKILYAGKLFKGDDGKAKMTLYYPDRLEYYTSNQKYEDVSAAEAFQPDLSVEGGKAPNPYGKVPVFHFKTNRSITSDLKNVIPLQNGVNKLLSDMMVAAEYGAFKQRYVISQSDTSELKNAPNEVWNLPASDGMGQATSAGEFTATELKNYLDAMDRLALSIGIITRTPKHYFFGSSGDPSGEALIAMEAPLNKKVQDRIDRFRPVWRDLAAFILQIEGTVIDPTEITPQFDKPETVQPKTAADITKVRTDTGVPLVSALRWEGKTQTEIDAMQKDQDEAQKKSQSSLAQVMIDAERRMREQGLGGNPPNPQKTEPTQPPQNGNNRQPANENV